MKTWLIIFVGIWMTGFAHAQDVAALRKERDALITKGRWKEALDFYREKLIDQNDPPAGDDLEKAVSCVRQLSAWGEFDALVELAVEKHPQHSRVLAEAGEAYLSIPHGGRWIAGEFERTGWYGWGGRRGGRGSRARLHGSPVAVSRSGLGSPRAPHPPEGVGARALRIVGGSLTVEAWRQTSTGPWPGSPPPSAAGSWTTCVAARGAPVSWPRRAG